MYKHRILPSLLLCYTFSGLVCFKGKEYNRKALQHSNFTTLGNINGYLVVEHDVVTEDGYILKVFHIPGSRTRPVLLMHGLFDSADTFIIRGRGSLAIALAEKGYDVWAGNSRGNRYSRRHVTLNPDGDQKFWDFSFHEIGYYDLPAIIDFVLYNTGQNSLFAVGHSQGNTIFYVLGSTRPEYNDKIKVLIAVSPVCFLKFPKPAIKTFIILAPIIEVFLNGLGEILGDNTVLSISMDAICSLKNIGYEICAYGVFFPIGGSDPDEVEPEFFPVIIAHFPTGTSKKNLVHLSQLAHSKSFSEYDYGTSRNLDLYQSSKPAKYDLSRVKMQIAMLFGDNDGITSLKDVNLLQESLPNVVEYRKIAHKKFNHLDAVWGRNMNIYLFPNIFDIFNKYMQ